MKNQFNLNKVNADIVGLVQLVEDVGWKSINEWSIQRIFYLCTVLYSFKRPQTKNPFMEQYKFAVDLRGPYSDLISKSLIDLQTQDYLFKSSDNSFTLSDRDFSNLNKLPEYLLRHEWVSIVVFILGIYGEDKIYDFIFKDPEYVDAIKRQSAKSINTSEDNLSISSLKKFKEIFEENLGEQANALKDKDYLEMYFEFIFSKILKGN